MAEQQVEVAVAVEVGGDQGFGFDGDGGENFGARLFEAALEAVAPQLDGPRSGSGEREVEIAFDVVVEGHGGAAAGGCRDPVRR